MGKMRRTYGEQHIDHIGDVRIRRVDRDIFLESYSGRTVTGRVLLARIDDARSVVDASHALAMLGHAVDSLLPMGWLLMGDVERNEVMRKLHSLRHKATEVE